MATVTDLRVTYAPPTDVTDHARVRILRAGLPHQASLAQQTRIVAEEHTAAAAEFGVLLSRQEIHRQVRQRLPYRRGRLVAVGLVAVLFALCAWYLVPTAQSASAARDLLTQMQDAYRAPELVTAQRWALTKLFFWTMGLALGLLASGVTLIAQLEVMHWERSTRWTDIEAYERLIPDAALLKWDAAQTSGYFTSFDVVEPAYRDVPQRDPWLVGHLKSPHRRTKDNAADDPIKASIVLAYWE